MIAAVVFSDSVIKKMSIVKRTIAMLIAVVVLTGIFAWIFDWFPVEELRYWLYFFVCFGISFAASVIASVCKENMDNRRLEAGLKRLKEGSDKRFWGRHGFALQESVLSDILK